jgi:hypothetical protein
MNESQKWYIIKDKEDYCQIVLGEDNNVFESEQKWGPFNSQEEAIAKRVGLIRAGKCQPK